MQSYSIYPEILHSSMIKIEGGTFLLEDKIECEVSDFYLGQYPVNQQLWEQVMGENPSSFKGTSLPVESISWYDCVEFCNRLSEREGLEKVYQIDKSRKDPPNTSNVDKLKWIVIPNIEANGYRLPTETEWEYAARGGKYAKSNVYAGSPILKEVGWYYENSHMETQLSGMNLPNELGFYDMSGNVREWCWDWKGNYPSKRIKDYRGPEGGLFRVLRGGSWGSYAGLCRVSFRYRNHPDDRSYVFGFRLARTAGF